MHLTKTKKALEVNVVSNNKIFFSFELRGSNQLLQNKNQYLEVSWVFLTQGSESNR